MSKEQQQLHDTSKQIEQLVANIDDNNSELGLEIEQCQDALKRLEKEKGPHAPAVPGQKIHNMLQAWMAEEAPAPEELQQYAAELWLSLAEYEQTIRSEQKSYQIELKQ